MRDFNHTVNVLVKAYLNDMLEHGDCSACAVGNIVVDSLGKHADRLRMYAPLGKHGRGEGWPAVFCSTGDNHQRISPVEYKGEARLQIDSTGYTWQELARIEKAFESCNTNARTRDGEDLEMFNGLMAVVDVLAEIHGISLEEKQQAKGLFVKVG